MSTEITINQDIVEVNVTEQVITIEAPSGAYPLPNLVSSVFGRVGNVVAQEGDYTLTQIGDVTLTSPSNGQVLKYNGTAWVNSSDTDTGLTSVGLSMPSAFSVANSPLTANGTLSVTGAGIASQYIRGDGTLATFPSLTGYVPYTGATANLDLGTFDLTADIVNANDIKALTSAGLDIYSNSGTHIALMGGGGGAGTTFYGGIVGTTGSFASSGGSDTFAINHSSGSGIALNITKGGAGEGLYINKTSGSGNAATIIGTLNATTLVKSGGTSSQYLMADGSTSTLTNPVTGTGTTNTLPKFTGASTIGNSNVSDSGTLITLGSNTTISSGGLQIGPNTLSTHSLIVGKNVTGSAFISVVTNDGSIQSDVTSNVWNYRSGTRTAAASFTLTNFTHFIADQASIGAGSSITTQEGFIVNSTMIGATNNYGFRGLIPSGTNRWNIYMDGTANNYMAGSLGIGSTSLTDTTLNIAKNITGAATYVVVRQSGVVQSDANTNVIAFNNQINTQATSFALTQYIHYNATQGTIGAGSSVGTNIGFNVSPSMIGGTNNLGFRGSIPVGAGRWNLFIDGTAANFLAGDTGIGTQTLGTATQLTVGGTETASSAIARGGLINTTLVASANNDTLVGLDIQPTFTAGAFTGINSIALRINGNLTINNGGFQLNNSNVINVSGSELLYAFSGGWTSQVWYTNAVARMRLFGTTGNLLLQNGGTFTDAGFRLDVNGTARVQGLGIIGNSATIGGRSDIGLSVVTNVNNSAISIFKSAGSSLHIENADQTNNSYTNISLRTDASGNAVFSNISLIKTSSGTGSLRIHQNGTQQLGLFYTTGNLVLQNGGTFTDVASSRLTVNSTTQGFLPPRMTTTQKLAIATPAAGLMVYDTTLNQMSYFNGTLWINF